MSINRPITIILILLAAFLLAFFLVLPEYRTFGKLRAELGEKRAEFNAKFDYYASVAKIYDVLQSRQDDIKKISGILSTDPTLGRTVYFLQKTAKENGLLVKNLFLARSLVNVNANDKVAIKDLIFSLDLIGDYPSLENFIIALEKSSRIFETINISFGSAENPPYNFNLQIKTYSY